MLATFARRGAGLVHRWLGLFTAVFLALAGTTGAVIAWEHELDGWLNPAFYEAPASTAVRSPLDVADAIERANPHVRVTYLPLATTPGEAMQVWVEPRLDPATAAPYAVDFNEIAVDPATGREQARRYSGGASLSRENLIPFLYKFHSTLQLPAAGGYDVGTLFMGIVAIVWVFDAFVSLWLAFPSLKSWRKSFAFRWKRGGHALTFDLHRSGGVWIWLLMLALAVTAVSMNLRAQVVVPIVAWLSPLGESPFDRRTPAAAGDVGEPALDRAEAIRRARAEATRRGWTAPPGALLFSPEYRVYGVGFFAAADEHADYSLGNPWLYFDAQDGSPAGADVPGHGSAGDLFLQAQFPIHSGRILGTPGRVAVSLLGLAIASLSVTGVVIWLRKRRARARTASRAAPARIPSPSTSTTP
ncbi:MAG TPA: PepSY-associated TM helix domain-containing protein [Dokdonella sp.]